LDSLLLFADPSLPFNTVFVLAYGARISRTRRRFFQGLRRSLAASSSSFSAFSRAQEEQPGGGEPVLKLGEEATGGLNAAWFSRPLSAFFPSHSSRFMLHNSTPSPPPRIARSTSILRFSVENVSLPPPRDSSSPLVD
jgi:hypothetical protein